MDITVTTRRRRHRKGLDLVPPEDKRKGGRPKVPGHLRKIGHTVRLLPHISDEVCRISVRDLRSVYSVLEAIITTYIEIRLAKKLTTPLPFKEIPRSPRRADHVQGLSGRSHEEIAETIMKGIQACAS